MGEIIKEEKKINSSQNLYTAIREMQLLKENVKLYSIILFFFTVQLRIMITG